MYVCVGVWPSDVSDERVWETTLIYLARVVCNWCITVVFVSVCIHHGEVVFGDRAKDLTSLVGVAVLCQGKIDFRS